LITPGKYLLVFMLALVAAGCTGIPENVSPVTGFDVNRYLGTWYEIARLDHSFERGLERVTAEYSRLDDGGIRVVNQGFNAANKSWKRAEGKAYFISAADVGRLKVSFFGPFYGSYTIIDLDHRGYRYSMVCGPNKSYLWILARAPQLDPPVLDRLLAQAVLLGFDTEQLIYVNHGAAVPSAVIE
jgi:apolipoprotein D and lipocalin family protein